MLGRAIFFALVILYTRADDETAGPVFTKEPPNRVDFSNTTGAVVECNARGNPPPDIIWVRSDGTAVGDVPGLRQVLANGNLVFPPFRAEDYRQEVHAQVYACLAKNNVGTINSRDVNVRAVVNQYYEAQVYDVFVIKGNTAVFKCQIPSFVSDHVEIVSWQDTGNNQFLPPTSDYDSKYLVLPSGELHIRDVGPEDGYKSYQCRTKHRLTGETRLSATKGRLVITEPVGTRAPKLLSNAKTVWFEGEINGTIALLCQGQGFPTPKFRWYKFIDGTSRKQAVQLNDRVKQVAGTLIIREAKVEDSGKYLCVVNNSVGGESVETVLTVTAPLKASIEPKVQTIDFGRPAVFTCKFEGNPIKTISWMKDGNKIEHTDAVLKIDAVRKEDKGMYQCFIRNDQESAEATGELKLGGRFEPPQIRHAFNEETVQPGNSVFLKCIASGNPTPEITWEVYGRRLSNSDRYQIGQYVTVNGDVVSHLNVTGIHTNDGGLYRCIASSKVGSADHSARINVYGLPFVRSMEKQAIVAGGTLIVHCPFAGHPVDTVVWERDGRQLPINRKQKVFPNGTLIIENVERASDQATYVCVAKNSQGYNARGSLEVQVMVAPVISPFQFDGPLNAGDSAVLTCYVPKGDKPLKIKWYHNNRHVNHHSKGISTSAFGSQASLLNIASVEPHHKGDYTCLVTNTAGKSSYVAHLDVNVPPQVSHFTFSDEVVNSGEMVSAQCVVSKGDFPIKISWYYDKKPADLLHGVTVAKLNKRINTLSIELVDAVHAGEYTCVAENAAGEDSYTAVLNVNVPPQIHPFDFGDESIDAGELVTAACAVSKGDSPIEIMWFLNGHPIDQTYGIVVSNTNKRISHLTIESSESVHTGEYTCIAKNAAGVTQHSAYLNINVPPQIHAFDFGIGEIHVGEIVTAICVVSRGDTPIRIHWFFNGQHLRNNQEISIIKSNKRISQLTIESADASNTGEYTCVAKNVAGIAKYSAFLNVHGRLSCSSRHSGFSLTNPTHF